MSMDTENAKGFAREDKNTQASPFQKEQRFQKAFTAYPSKRGALLYWAALLMLSAACMHCIAIVTQLPPSWVLAVLLISFTLVQAIVAVGVIAIPARLPLLIAGTIEGIGVLIWISAHSIGLPDGIAVWRPETLGVPDLYLPLVEAISAGFFFSLYGRTWVNAPRAGRMIFTLLPFLLLLGLLIGIVLKPVALVVFFLVPGAITSVQYFFLPLVALFAVFLILRLLLRPLRLQTPGAWRTIGILLPALLLVNLIAWGGGVSASETSWLHTQAAVSVPANQTATVLYCNSSHGSPLAMDISEPAVQATRPAPMVFLIHGGETLVGSRLLDATTGIDGIYFKELRTELLKRGFIVGSIDYGLVPLYNVGEQVMDAKCAVRFLRAHAQELGLDARRIGVYGPSQGGYISAMLGTLRASTYDVGQYLDQSSSVQAVVDMWGPTDLTNFRGSPGWASLLVGHGTVAQLRNSSPAYHVAPGDPPFLIMHGTDDWFIAPHHSQDMARRLQAAGVPVTLVMIQHDSHGLAMPTNGQMEQPSPDTLIQMIVDFFSRTLAA